MEKYLPIGTIVELKESDRLFMIVGYCFRMKLKKLNGYDYFMCRYPEGVVDLEKMVAINKKEIEKIYYMGYNSKKIKTFNKILEKASSKMEAKENE